MRTPRPTRGSTRRALVWSGLALVCLLGLFGARAGQDAAHERELDAATGRALAAGERIADRTGPAVDGLAPGAGVEELLVMLQAEVLTDPTVGSVRVYGADSTMRFATDRAAQAVIGERVRNGAVQAALGGEVERREVRSPFTRATTGQQGLDTDLLQVFVPLRVAGEEVVGAVQVDFLADALRSAAAGPWPSIQLALGLALLVCLGMTVVLWVPHRRADSTEEETGDAVDPEPVADAEGVASPDVPRPGFEERMAELEGRLAEAEKAAEEARGVLAAAAPPAGERRGSDDPKVLLQTLAGREEEENEEGADLRMRLGRAVDLKMMRDKDR